MVGNDEPRGEWVNKPVIRLVSGLALVVIGAAVMCFVIIEATRWRDARWQITLVVVVLSLLGTNACMARWLSKEMRIRRDARDRNQHLREQIKALRSSLEAIRVHADVDRGWQAEVTEVLREIRKNLPADQHEA